MPSPAILITLETAKDHLRITAAESAQDAQVEMYLDMAEDIVREYLDDQFDEGWDESTVPGSVKADILRTLAELWRHRGDDVPDGDADQNSTARVRFRHLYSRKGPTIA